jgi:hypothetical protein
LLARERCVYTWSRFHLQNNVSLYAYEFAGLTKGFHDDALTQNLRQDIAIAQVRRRLDLKVKRERIYLQISQHLLFLTSKDMGFKGVLVPIV